MSLNSQGIRGLAAAVLVAALPVAALAGSHAMGSTHKTFEDLEWVPMGEGSPAEISILWGDPATGPVGLLIRTPPGFEAPEHWHSSDYNTVVLQGLHKHWVEGEDPAAAPALGPGSHFSQVREQVHGDANAGDEPMIGVVVFDGPLDSFPKE